MSQFPLYIRLFSPDRGVAVIHVGDGLYHRPAGRWDIQTAWDDNGFQVCADDSTFLKHLMGRPCYGCTEEEYKQDNQGYV